jgi:hypothetical protein
MPQWWRPTAAIMLLMLASGAPAQERLKSTPKPDRSSMDDWCAAWKRPSDGRGDAWCVQCRPGFVGKSCLPAGDFGSVLQILPSGDRFTPGDHIAR